MSEISNSPGKSYLATVAQLIDRLTTSEWSNIDAGAQLLAEALRSGKIVHAFGTGHSHMLAEELFYRAGGLVRVSPILFEGLMLHSSAPLSTSLERLPGLADALLKDHPVHAGDVVIIASNSGSNAVTSELAQGVRMLGARVIAVTSLKHATSLHARSNALPRLHEIADVTVDNGGGVGDASIGFDDFEAKVGPTSTVIGAAILNAMITQTVGLLLLDGFKPEVYSSSNTAGGDAINEQFQQGEDSP